MNIAFYAATSNVLKLTMKNRKQATRIMPKILESTKEHKLIKFVVGINDNVVSIKMKNDTLKERVFNFIYHCFSTYITLWDI